MCRGRPLRGAGSRGLPSGRLAGLAGDALRRAGGKNAILIPSEIGPFASLVDVHHLFSAYRAEIIAAILPVRKLFLRIISGEKSSDSPQRVRRPGTRLELASRIDRHIRSRAMRDGNVTNCHLRFFTSMAFDGATLIGPSSVVGCPLRLDGTRLRSAREAHFATDQ